MHIDKYQQILSNIVQYCRPILTLIFSQYTDGVTGEMFFFSPQTGNSRWTAPPVPDMLVAQKRRNAQALLSVGDTVFYRFPTSQLSGGVTSVVTSVAETACVVLKARLDEATFDFSYDVAKLVCLNPSAPSSRFVPSGAFADGAKFVRRGLLRQKPKSVEEVRAEMEEAAWKAQLGRARERDGRALQRSKEAEAAEARRRRRGGRKKAERKALSAEEVERARGRRVEAEKAGRDDEERKRKEEGQARAVLAAAAKAGANVGAVEAQKRGGGQREGRPGGRPAGERGERSDGEGQGGSGQKLRREETGPRGEGGQGEGVREVPQRDRGQGHDAEDGEQEEGAQDRSQGDAQAGGEFRYLRVGVRGVGYDGAAAAFSRGEGDVRVT